MSAQGWWALRPQVQSANNRFVDNSLDMKALPLMVCSAGILQVARSFEDAWGSANVLTHASSHPYKK